MRTLSSDAVVSAVAELCKTAAFDLPADVAAALERAREAEPSPLGRSILGQITENALLARSERVPMCQDTGVAVYFVEWGQDLRLEGLPLPEALAEGTRKGYAEGYLRMSIVKDPLFERVNSKTNGPPVVHTEVVPGDRLRITLAPKGGGSENMSALAMLKPLVGREGVADFVVETVRRAGGNACPPVIVGVGVGGNFERAPYLAKKALLREVGSVHPHPEYAAFERELLERVNATGVGPQGLGGGTTALAVHVEAAPCHIASLPVAVNLNCHAARHASVEL